MAKTDTYFGQTVLVTCSKDKKWYRCRADEKQIKEWDAFKDRNEEKNEHYCL